MTIDEKSGLTESEVSLRIERGAVNVITDSNSVTIKEIIAKNVFTYFNLIFAVFAVLLIIFREYRGLSFMPIIIANTLIGIVQQIRSKRTLDKLNMLHAPKAHLIRGGKEVTVAAEAAVLDDIAVFSAGNQIYADAVVVSGSVSVNESLLTGESDEITKNVGDVLMSGSFVVSGECRARLDKVGNNSYIAQLSAKAKEIDTRSHSQMMSDLNKLIKIVGIIIIPIGGLMFLQQFFSAHLSAAESISRTIAALLGMIPEGLYLLASVALALSVLRLARKRVIVHDMSCVETLARVNVLCVDKTGTITDNTMKVSRLITIGDTNASDIRALISRFAASMSSDNITMEAIKEYFCSGKKDFTHATKIIPFSSVNKYSVAVFDTNAYVLGAPEFILRSDYSKYEKIIEKYTHEGYRAVLFAKYPSDGALTEKSEPLAFILLHNPVRKEAAETFRYFKEQGVKIKVISGDNPMTVSEVAREAGIDGAEAYIDMSDFDPSKVSEEYLCNAAEKYTVFGRVSPQTKRALIHALQLCGNTVAMTGDGVNDVLAL
jgi:cation-transporting ATPase E